MVISVRISDEKGYLVKAYAAKHGLSVSEFMRKAVYDQFDNDDVYEFDTLYKLAR